PGHWDTVDDAQNALDGPLPPTNAAAVPPPPSGEGGGVKFASMTINATNATINLTGLNDASSPFNGVLFFQRRRDTNSASINGNAGVNVHLEGIIYAKWANFTIGGGGVYQGQFVVGSMGAAGGSLITIDNVGRNFGLANQVFLVE